MNYAETSGFFGLLAVFKDHKNADEDEGKPRQEQVVLGGFNLVRSKKTNSTIRLTMMKKYPTRTNMRL